MPKTNDYFRQHGTLSVKEASQVRARALASGRNIVLTDPVQDEIWARYANADQQRPSNYYDYFFAGEDIQVRIAEIPETAAFGGDLPILSLAFTIEQEKTPVFGFWSYTYDAMMRGTRLVTGGFSIATKYPNYLTEILAQAASNRANKALIDDYSHRRRLTEDDAKIDQYWGKHILDPGLEAANQQHLFSVHPPFSLVINYGMQTTSIPVGNEAAYWNDYYVGYYDDRQNELMMDHNHRIVESTPTYENRLMVEAIELKSCERSFAPNGQLCAETYAFIARDVIVPTAFKKQTAQRAPLPSGPRVPSVD